MEYVCLTNAGGREINEDSVAVCEVDGNYCFVVADGLGGHGRGEEASALVTRCITQFFRENDHSVYCIEPAIEFAQTELLQEQKKKVAYFEMKTTVVVLVVEKSGLYRWGYVGDSRLYMLKKSRIKTQTLDHSVPQMLVMAGDIRAKDIRFHPDRNKLLRVMGIEWTRPMCDVSKPAKLKKGSAFLLCTDGFWELVDEEQICNCRKQSKTAQEWIDHMKEILVRCDVSVEKEMDNYTAAAILC